MALAQAFHFVHAFPNAWLPVPGNSLVIEGISAEDLMQRLQGREIVSHVRYEDHAERISAELGIDLPASGINAPSPYNIRGGYLVVASLTPGTTQVNYVLVHDAGEVLKEQGIWF